MKAAVLRFFGALFGLDCAAHIRTWNDAMSYLMCTRPRYHKGKHYHHPSGTVWADSASGAGYL